MQQLLIISLGFIAQLLFMSRMLSQWILSEKQKQVVTPHLFWQLSFLASFLMFVYGWLRNDFAIMLGQILTYFIYIRNMQLQGDWQKLYQPLRYFLYLFPVLIFVYSYNNGLQDRQLLFQEAMPKGLLLFGVLAQIIFILRFVYQWLRSERAKISYFPLGFWLLSLCGSLLILTYGILRVDYVLMVGHAFGILVYTRNIYLHSLQSRTAE